MSAFPAVRLADIGSHGNIMMLASPNVIINGLGAHRMGDIYICPLPFHGIGMTLINCSPTVLINGRQAARVTSGGVCKGVAVNVTGSPNVNIGP